MKCSICGGPVSINSEGKYVCDFCGTYYTSDQDSALESEVAEIQSQKKTTNSGELLLMADHNREVGDYDEAYYAYESYLQNNPEDARGYWGKVLSKFGVLFETEQVGGISITKPTLNRMNKVDITSDSDYIKAISYASEEQNAEYTSIASEISKIQKNYHEISIKEKPYDVFISFKAQDDKTGEATEDSSIAYEIYERLNSLGNLNIFFSRITLQEKKGGAVYEPYIYSALNSAKVMILVGTSPEYVNGMWVKNEWSRYLKQMQVDSTKTIIPVVKGMDKSLLPKQIPLGNVLTYNGDETLAAIAEGVLNVTGKGIVVDDDEKALSLLRESMKNACSDGDFKIVRDIAEEILNINAEFGEAYYYLLLAEYGVTKGTALADLDKNWTDSTNYKYAIRFADESLKNRLDALRERYETRVEDDKQEAFTKAEAERTKRILDEAMSQVIAFINEYKYKEAKSILTTKAYHHADAQKYLEICNVGIEAQQATENFHSDLATKNPDLYARYSKALSYTVDGPDDSLGESIVNLVLCLIAILAPTFLADTTLTNLYYSLIISTVAMAIACRERGFFKIASIVLGLFGLFLVWGADSDIGLMPLAILDLVLIVIFLVNVIRNVYVNMVDKKFNVVRVEKEKFEKAEYEALKNRYVPQLGEAFWEAHKPNLYTRKY